MVERIVDQVRWSHCRIADVSMDQLEKLRAIIQPAPTVRLVADEFVATLQRTFESVALARLFLVLPHERSRPQSKRPLRPIHAWSRRRRS